MKHTRAVRLLVSFAVAILTLILTLPAQAGEDWPPVLPEELAMKDSPGNPGAPAVILYRKVVTNDREKFESRYFRIKVLTDAGKKYADIEIPYYEKWARVEDIQARTVRPDGHEVPFTGQVYDKLVVKGKGLKVQAKTFTLSDVQIGSIVEYSYRVTRPHVLPAVLYNPQRYIIDSVIAIPTAHWSFQHDLFTRHASFRIIPVLSARLGWSITGQLGAQPSRAQDGTIQLDLENIPSFEEEEYMPPEDIVRSHMDLSYVVGSFGNPGGFWAQQARTRTEGVEKFMDKRKAMERAVAQLVSPSDSPEVKLRKIYARAQQVRALSYEQSRTEKEEKAEHLKDNEDVEDVLKRGYARANEINLFFAALARAAGFEAAPVLTAARNRTFFSQGNLDLEQLSAMVVWVRMGSEDLYLDPATRFCPFRMLPWEETGVEGIRLNKSAVAANVFASTPAPVSADSVLRRKAALKLDLDGTAQGTIQVSYTGQEALQRRLENVTADAAGRRKALEELVKGWLPSGATVELKNSPEWERGEEPLSAEFTVKIPNFGAATGRRLLLPLAIFQAAAKYPFQNARRLYAVYFDFPFQEIDEVTLQAPEGYTVESTPEPRKKEFPFAKYEISRQSEGNALRLERRLTIEKNYIPRESYSAVRLFYDSVRAGDEEQVVLKAAEAVGKN